MIASGNLTDFTETEPRFFEPSEDADVLEAELIEQSVIVYSDSWLINDFYIHRNIVVPAAQWEIGDPIIYGTRIETYSVPLFVAGFEPDWEGVYWSKLIPYETLIVTLTWTSGPWEPCLPGRICHQPCSLRGLSGSRQRRSSL